MLVAVVNSGIVFTVPPLVVTADDVGGGTVVEVAESLGPLDGAGVLVDGAASTKAEAGSPPKVAASPAFSAYGTLTRAMRGCSASVPICTASHRASPVMNTSGGSPFLLTAPNCTV